jgi:hypothetical protein
VIVASGGVAEAIAREVGDSAGLQLQTLEEFARRIVRRRVASDGERRLAMRTAVRKIDDPLMSTRGIAAMLDRSYRDMRDSGVRLADVRLRRAPVARAFAEYEKLIAAIGAIDPADLLTLAAQDVSDVKPQIVAGFYDMTGAQWGLVDALAGAGKVIAFFSPTAPHPAFAPLLPASGAKGPAASTLPSWDVREHERRDVEIREVCFAIDKLIADGAMPRDIGIVTRALDDYDLHLFHRYATFPLSHAEETPLLAHRLGRAIASLLRIRERSFPRGEVLELVRDGIRFETRLNADAVDRETRAKRVAGGTSSELKASRKKTTRENDLIGDYIALVAEVEALAPESAKRGSEWSAWLTNVTSRFRIEAEVDLAAIERVETIADLFRRADAMRTTFDAAAVLDAIEHESIEGTRTRDAVWIGDVMKFRGRTFRHLFAVRMQDDTFPQRRTDDPLLPDSERRQLGIREIGDGRDEERILFQLLFDGTDHVTFSFSSSDGFGKVLRPSQLLKNFVVEQRPGEKAALLKNFTFRLPVVGSQLPASDNRQLTTDHRRQLQLLARSATNGPFDGFLTDPSLLEKFASARPSPTALEDFGECPQKFLVKHLLGAFDVDDPERELQIHHREKGSIDHRILESFYRSLSEGDYAKAEESLPEVPPELIARLESAVDAEFERFEFDAPPFNRNIRTIERRATKRILRDFVARDLADIFESGLRPQQFEYKFERGRIDRIDGDGVRLRVIDYKSGKALRHVNLGEKIDRGVRLQLAVYANAIAEAFDVDPANVVGAIKPLTHGEAKPQAFAFNLGEKRAALQETLAIFSRAIANGRFPAFPNEKDFNSCKYCPVNHSCRTKHDAEEKYAVLQLHDPRTLLQLLEGPV